MFIQIGAPVSLVHIAWLSFGIQVHRIHNNASFVMEHFKRYLRGLIEIVITYYIFERFINVIDNSLLNSCSQCVAPLSVCRSSGQSSAEHAIARLASYG